MNSSRLVTIKSNVREIGLDWLESESRAPRRECLRYYTELGFSVVKITQKGVLVDLTLLILVLVILVVLKVQGLCLKAALRAT
jgi:hypothetical protein